MVAAVAGEVAGLQALQARLAVTLHRHLMTGLAGRPRAVPNVVVVGPSGGGKTHTVRALLRASGLPFIEVGMTGFSDVGWIGRDLSSMMLEFLQPPWCDRRERREMVPLAERWGVVVLDEWDKLRATLDLRQVRDRQPQKVLQSELLRMVEGEMVMSRRGDDDHEWPFWTGDMLFIAVGAFQGLNSVVEDRLDRDDPRAYMQAIPEDLARYGFLEELVGRFSTILTLPPLDPVQLARVLLERVWPAYVAMAADDGMTLVATEPALLKVAQRAALRSIGARALAPELERLLWQPWHAARPGLRMVLDVAEVDAGCARLEEVVCLAS
jgi:ATP-dependent Clp protease ATP-binding subunit ClpX